MRCHSRWLSYRLGRIPRRRRRRSCCPHVDPRRATCRRRALPRPRRRGIRRLAAPVEVRPPPVRRHRHRRVAGRHRARHRPRRGVGDDPIHLDDADGCARRRRRRGAEGRSAHDPGARHGDRRCGRDRVRRAGRRRRAEARRPHGNARAHAHGDAAGRGERGLRFGPCAGVSGGGLAPRSRAAHHEGARPL